MFSDLPPKAFLQQVALEANCSLSCDSPSLAGSDTLSHRNTRGRFLSKSVLWSLDLQGHTAEGTQETGCSFLEKAGDRVLFPCNTSAPT